MNDQKIALTLPLVNAVLQYLGKQPFDQVFQLVQAIQEQAIPQMPVPASAQAPTDVVSVE